MIENDGDRPVIFGAGDPSPLVLAGDEPPLAVSGVAVRVVRRLAKNADRAGFFVPAHDAIIGDVAPQQITAVAEPHWPFGPAKTVREPLDRGIEWRLDRVKARIQRPDRRVRIALSRFPAAGCERCGRTDNRRDSRSLYDCAHQPCPTNRRRSAESRTEHHCPSGSVCRDLPDLDRNRLATLVRLSS